MSAILPTEQVAAKKTCRLLQEANQPVSSAQHKTKAKSSIRINISASGTALCTTWLQLWVRYDYSKPKDSVSGYSKSGPNTNRRNGEVLLQSSRFTRTCLQVNLAPLLRKGTNGKNNDPKISKVPLDLMLTSFIWRGCACLHLHGFPAARDGVCDGLGASTLVKRSHKAHSSWGTGIAQLWHDCHQ